MRTLILLILISTVAFAQQKGTFTDSRDKKKYKTVKIGEQTWMAENLNFETEGSACYDKKPANCTKYGRLYDWATALKIDSTCNKAKLADCSTTLDSLHQGVCPEGWHLPSDKEWQTLVDFVGGEGVAGTKLKSKSGWNKGSVYIAGADNYGFSALPGGMRFSDVFTSAGIMGNWWSSSESEDSSDNVHNRSMGYGVPVVNMELGIKTDLYSVRCLKD